MPQRQRPGHHRNERLAVWLEQAVLQRRRQFRGAPSVDGVQQQRDALQVEHSVTDWYSQGQDAP